MTKKYEYHDIANGYPMATTAEFEMLKNSISEHGQELPITTYEGKILDGRNRYKACIELEIEPIIKEFTGTYDEAEEYSQQLNSGRRNMDKSQQAMVAAYHIERTRKNGVAKMTIKKASQSYSVSEKYIKRALRIINDDPNIAEQVFDGHEGIGRAEKRIEEIQYKQREIDYIQYDVSRDKSSEMDIELSDTYNFLYNKEKKDLVDIIVRNGFMKKGTNTQNIT